MVAPCVEVLHHLANMMNGLLGTDLDTRHEPVDLSNDIPELMRSLDISTCTDAKRAGLSTMMICL